MRMKSTFFVGLFNINVSVILWKHHARKFIIAKLTIGQLEPSLGIESFAIVNLRCVFTKLY